MRLSCKYLILNIIFFLNFITQKTLLQAQVTPEIIKKAQTSVEENKKSYSYLIKDIKFEEIKPLESSFTPASITSIEQTADGFLWLGTSNGLVRYDGLKLLLFDNSNTPAFINPAIYCLFRDKDNTLWIGTEKGICILKNGIIRRIDDDIKNDQALREKISNAVINKIFQDKKGTIWFCTDGLLKYENNEFSLLSSVPNTSIRTIAEDNNGNLYLGTTWEGLLILKNNKIIRYSMTEGLSDNCIRDMIFDHNGFLWIATRDGGINRLYKGENRVFNQKNGLPNNLIESIFEDKEKNVWFGSGGGGISLYKENRFSTFTKKDGLSHSYITSFFQDKEKTLWIGTSSGDLNRLKREKARTFSENDGLSGGLVWCVMEGWNNDIWVGTNDGGISRLSGNKISIYNTSSGLKTNIVRSLGKDHEGNIWIGNKDFGLIKYYNGKFSYYNQKDGLPSTYVKSIYEDSHKNLWVGTSDEIVIRKNKKFIPLDNTGNKIKNVRVIKEDKKGNLWFARNGGVTKYYNGITTEYTTANGLKANGIMSIHIDNNDVIWIATYSGGLHRLENDHFTYYSSSNGLRDDWIYEILEDNRNNLWMSSNKGIFYVNKNELNDVAYGKSNKILSHPIGKDEGLLVAECNGGSQPAGYKTKEGILFFSTMNGIAIIDPEKVLSALNVFPPPIVIDKFIVDDSVIAFKDSTVELTAGKLKFEFYFSNLSFVNPSRNKCRFKLAGFDKDWKESQHLSFVYYTNLPYGDYEFKVIGCNNDGIWNESGDVFRFRLAPFFYQTYWFLGICIVLLGCLIFLIIYLREKRLIRKEKELRQIVDERTKDLREQESQLKALNSDLTDINATKDKLFSIISHDLRGPIGTVMNYSQILTDQWNELAEHEIKDFIKVLRSVSEKTYDLLENLLYWSRSQRNTIDFRPQFQEINPLVEDNIGLLQPNAGKKGLFLINTIEEPISAYYDKNMIKTVIRNLISNALKFTKEGGIKISAIQNNSNICISIIDTGSGISEENLNKLFRLDQNFTTKGTSGEKGTGLGLILCKEFIEKNNGTISVESEPGKGSIFSFTLPKEPPSL